MIKRNLIFVILFAVLLLSASFLSAQNENAGQIDVIKIDDYIISPVTAKFICSAIDNAQRNKAVCLIIELDTPGGLLESTRTVVKAILNSEVPVVTYISPSGSRAGSAGVFIAYASHIVAMAPSTNIGAAHPIGIGFMPTMEKEEKSRKGESRDVLSEKTMNDLLAWVEGIAINKKRNVQWVKDAVTKSVSATETEALKQNVIDLVAVDLKGLIGKIDGMKVQAKYSEKTLSTKGARINLIELSGREKVLNTVANPQIAYILFLLGIIGLIFEFSHPGINFPGIAGLICILLALYSFQLLPINYAGLLLIILAIILFIAEALTSAFGLLTLGGIVSFIFGSLMLVKSPYPFLKISLQVIIPVLVPVLAITLFLVANAVKIHRRKVLTGKEGLTGETATALAEFDKHGKVFCHGEIWTAQNTKHDTIKKGETVKIVKIEGLKLLVEKMK